MDDQCHMLHIAQHHLSSRSSRRCLGAIYPSAFSFSLHVPFLSPEARVRTYTHIFLIQPPAPSPLAPFNFQSSPSRTHSLFSVPHVGHFIKLFHIVIVHLTGRHMFPHLICFVLFRGRLHPSIVISWVFINQYYATKVKL